MSLKKQRPLTSKIPVDNKKINMSIHSQVQSNNYTATLADLLKKPEPPSPKSLSVSYMKPTFIAHKFDPKTESLAIDHQTGKFKKMQIPQSEEEQNNLQQQQEPIKIEQDNKHQNHLSEPIINIQNVDSQSITQQQQQHSMTINSSQPQFPSINQPINKQNTMPNIFGDVKIYQQYDKTDFGPKFKNGQIVQYSLAGKSEWFMNYQNQLINNDRIITNEDESVITKSKDASKADISHYQDKSNQEIRQRKITTAHNKAKSKTCKIQEDILRQDDVEREINQITQRINNNKKGNEIYNQVILNRLDKGDQLYMTKEARIIDKYQQNQQMWKQIIDRNSARVGRNPQSSIAMQSEAYRAKIETAKVFEVVESDIVKYGEHYWQKTLRKPQQAEDDIDMEEAAQLEVIRKPKSALTRSPYEGIPPFTTFSSGKYFQNKLKQNINKLQKVKHLDDREIEELEIKGFNKLDQEIKCLQANNNYNGQQNQQQYQQYIPKSNQKITLPTSYKRMQKKKEEDDNLEQIIESNYNKAELRFRGALATKQFHLKVQIHKLLLYIL